MAYLTEAPTGNARQLARLQTEQQPAAGQLGLPEVRRSELQRPGRHAHRVPDAGGVPAVGVCGADHGPGGQRRVV